MPQPPYTPDVPANQRVNTSSRLWSQECAMAEAADAMDSAGAGAAGLERLVEERTSVAYEFANGRKFVGKRNPYA
jgi:hypothetical protein